MISRRIIIVVALLISMLYSSAQAQDALLVYSPCAHCPGCFADCAQIPPDAVAPVCPVCQEGAQSVALPRTGQTLCYSSNGDVIDCAGTGQDGQIQEGVVWPSPRFTDNLDGSMTDNLTGLVWLKDANCISTQYPDFDNDGLQAYQLGDGFVTLQHAFDFVRGINDGTYPNCGAGRIGWRLPNINESESLMNVGEIQPLTWLTGQGFQNLLTNYYWSSTTLTYGNHQAWVLDFYSGNPYRTYAGKYSDRHYPVWPVSGTTASPARVPKTGQVKCYRSAEPWGEIPCAGTGQDGEIQAGAFWPAPRFVDNSDGTITDNLTGLMWLKDGNCFGGPVWQLALNPTWQGSLNIISDFNANPGNYTCAGYSANHNDWRLANINEQESLFNAAETNHSAWLSGNGYLFRNVQGYWYWSSTSRVQNMSSAVWAFNMIDGVVAPGSKNFTGLYVWPVRTAPLRFILTVTKQGAGSGTVTTLNNAGIDCGADCTEPYDNGTDVTLQAAADAGFELISWGGDPDCSDGVVTMDAHKTCTAIFDIETHTITVTKDGTGTGTVLIGGPGGPVVCGNDCQETYTAGIGILLDTVVGANSEFSGWSGDPDCEDGHVLMDADKTCNAAFNLQSHRLIIGKPGNGSGTVTSVNVAGINCGNDCSELYPVGTIVTLQATPDQWNVFSGWGGDPDCADGEVTISDADVTCFAVFNIQTYSLTVTKAGTGNGVVITNEQEGINCGLDCVSAEKTYNGGTEVTLTAGTELPWVFAGWGGDPDCDDGIVTMDADKTCIATFNRQGFRLSIQRDDQSAVTSGDGGINCGMDCDETYDSGADVRLTVDATIQNRGEGLVMLSGDPGCSNGDFCLGCLISFNVTITMDSDKTCIATFRSFEDLQFEEMQWLRGESQKTPEFRIENGIPRFISMRVPIPAALPDDPLIQALDFLDRYKYLYRISAPNSDLYLKRIKTNRFDEVGGGQPDPGQIKQHLFFGQQKDGIPVYGATLAVHMRGNMITSTSGNYLTDLPDFKVPAVQAPSAEAIALADVQGNSKKITGVTKLFYYNKGLTAIGGGTPDPGETPTKLAWRVMVRGLRNSDGAGTSWRLFIDAQDGTVLSKIDELRTDRAEKDFDIETANNTTSDTCWNGLNTDDDEWFDESGETGYPGADDDNYGDGRNAFDFAHFTYDFYFNNFHHHSWNNGQGVVCGIFGCPGEAQVEVMVHVGNNWDNASYIPACDHLRFGDGYVSDDTFAHEYTHAVTRWSAGLEYENQSGALDESYSDVMAAMLDNDWLQSEGIAPPGEDGERGGTRGGTSDKDGNIVGDGVREKGSECDNGVANDGGGNGVDDDEDGFIDEGCPETDIDCGNGQDDDGDGFNDEGCPETGNNCGDGNDDDGDTYIDEGCPGSCQDGIDNGLTGEADSADTDCILRDLANPSRKGDPDHINANMSGDGYGIRVLEPGTEVNCDRNDTNYNDCGWVHTNSGIMNKAAYLMTMGGVHTGSGIEVRGLGGMWDDGREKARRLYYDVLTTRMFPTAFFINARDETVEQAAIYAENNDYGFLNLDVCSVINAFAAVGLGAADVDCDGTLDYRDGDNDGDGIRDNNDNCPNSANIRQEEMDGDGIGDKCDPDTDGDGISNVNDNCPTAANGDQDDADVDGTGDACEDDDLDGVFNPADTCPGVRNAGFDTDGDGIDNACDDDNDGDGVDNESDNCPSDYNPAQVNNDTDEYGNACDNCDFADNPDQRDMNNDGQGDACDDDIDGDGAPNADDPCPVNALPVVIMRGSEVLPCQSNEDLASLLSGNYGDFVNGHIQFPSLTDSIRLPVFPCIDDGCPDWIDENYMTEVSLSLPADMQARIIDDKGFVISKGKDGMTKTMSFHPAADYFFRFAENMPSPAGAANSRLSVVSFQQSAQPAAFKGRSYFVEIYPSADVIPGQQYSFAIRVQSRLIDPLDIDNDGYPVPTDCNDNNAAIHPGAAEVCDGVDNNCDGNIDEGIVLDDGNACTEDKCDPVIGVYHIFINPDDGNACTEDACNPVLGVYHMLVDPDDGNACTEDRCIPELGVFHEIINPDDGNACTEDRCVPELGVFHSIIDPDDGNACTEDRCIPELGVFHEIINPDDGNACTEDRCIPELGVFHEIINPDDGNACTEDTCDPVSGVQHIPINAVEICDGIDNNCNGQIDEGMTQTWYRDGDNDGYSNGFTTESCDQPEGYKKDWQLIALSGDCDDANSAINPGVIEGPPGNPTCVDQADNDCDGSVDIQDTDCIPLKQPDLAGSWRWLSAKKIMNRWLISGNFRVINKGNADAGPFVIKYYFAPLQGQGMQFIGQSRVQRIRAGLIRDLFFIRLFKSSTSGGYIHAVIDAENAVTEGDEFNNNVIKPIP